MAVTHNIFVRVQDSDGDISTITVPVPASTSATDLALFAGEMAKLIRPLLKGQVVGVGAVLALDLATVYPGAGDNDPASVDADYQEGARFQFATTNGFTKSTRIPTFSETLLVSGSPQVDETDPDVAAFISAMTNGIDLVSAGGSGTIAPCDVRGEDLTALKTALEHFVATRG